MEEKTYSAKTLADAITDACADLGVTSDKLSYTVVQESTNGFFGIGARPCIIRVKVVEEKEFSIKDVLNEGKPEKKGGRGAENKEERGGRNGRENRGGNDSREGRDGRRDNAENRDARGESRDGKGNRDGDEGRDGNRGGRDDRRKNDARRGDRKDFGGRKPADGEDRGEAQTENRSEAQSERPETGRERTERESFRRDGQRDGRGYGKGQKEYGRGQRKKPYADEDRNSSENRAERVRENRAHERRPERTGTVTGDPVKTAGDFLTGLFRSMEMNISYSGVFHTENNELVIDLSGEDMGVLIGKRGQTLDALQYLTSQVVNKSQSAYIRVKLDTENYRERRKETMETLAQNIAQKVRRTRKPVALEPMNPYERRIIHSVLQSDKEVITRSEGVEPYRHVVICPARKPRKGGYGMKPETIAEREEVYTETVEVDAVLDAEKPVAEAAAEVIHAEANVAEAEVHAEAAMADVVAENAAEAVNVAENTVTETVEAVSAETGAAIADAVTETVAEAITNSES